MGFFDDLSEQVGLLSERAGEFIDDVLVPDEVRRLLERASRLIARENYDQALSLLERAAEQTDDIYRLHYLVGLCHFFRREYRDARKAFERALELREKAEAHYYAGLTAEQREAWSRARRHFQRALSIEESLPFDAEVYFALGRVFSKLDRPDRAARELERALESADSGDEPAAIDTNAVRIFLAEALASSGDPGEAYEIVEEVEPPDDPEILTSFARIAAEAGHPERARSFIDRTLELAPAFGPALLVAGRLARRAGELDAAEDHLLAAVKASQTDHLQGIYEELGPLYEQRGDFEQALRAFDAALDEAPDDADLHLHAARVALRLDRFDDAYDHFERASELTATDPHAQAHRLAERGLGFGALRTGDLSQARRRLDTLASREDPPHPETLWLRASLHLRDDDPGQALASAHSAIQLLQRSDFADAEPETQTLLSPSELEDRLQEIRHTATERLEHDWQLPDELNDSVDIEQTLETLRSFLTADARLERFFGRWRAISNRMERPLSVALVGEFNVGKSTLANALLGEEVVPMGILPTTAHTCRIGYGARRACRIVYRPSQDSSDDSDQDSDSERRVASGVEQLRSVWRYSDVVEVDFAEAAERMKDEADDIHHLEYLFPHPRLRSLELVDTPGFNAEDAHGDIARSVIDDAEAIVWVLDAGQALSMTEFEIIDDIRDSDERLVVVVNKLDELGDSPEERTDAADELRSYLEDSMGERIAGLFPMAAERVLNRATGDGEVDELDAEQFEAFTERLEGDIVQKSGRLKTLEARRDLRSLVENVIEFRDDHLQMYRSTVDELEEIGEDLRARAEDLGGSLADDISMRVADQIDFATEAAAGDLDDMMRPADDWMSQAFGERELDESDREFIAGMLADRIRDILQRARRETERRVDELQNEALDRLDSGLTSLETEEHRFVRRRLEAMVDESRSHRVLLEERVFGQIRADLKARLEATGDETFRRMAQGAVPREQWPDELHGMLPAVGERLESSLATWCETFSQLLTRTARRLADDVNLLRLEADAKWQLQPLADLVGVDRDSPE